MGGEMPPPDLVVAHDYQTCAMAFDAARKYGCEYVVDSHEYSAAQLMHDPVWVSDMRPVICAVQDYYLSRAAAVTTVCDGIAGHLNDEQTLRRPVTVVRSVPHYSEQQYRPVGDEIVLLYHGDVSYVRGLHKAIKSMPLWRPEFRLLIRGAGDAEYMRYLRELVSDLNLIDRVEMVPPVPFDEIVSAANKADVGYFVHKDLSPQKKYVLPNKFFEYIMSGLAMCVNDLPEMARLVRQFELGQLVDDYDEEAIARAVNSLTREKINDCKKRSLIAAQTLNWESEQKEMLDLYNSIT
jgi:glycosyltransferase involved in cell wall biosynthesis